MNVKFIFVPLFCLTLSCVKKESRTLNRGNPSECERNLPLQIYMTYIPPEGDILAKEILNKHSCCPVLVIQNGHDATQIFKRPIEFFGTPDSIYFVDKSSGTKEMISPNATNQNSNDNIGSAFATLLRKSLSERSSDGSSLPKPNESSLQNPELKFTVFSFRGSSQKPPALIMESVEMG